MHYSIVMPAYNVEAYIEDAVSDIEKQSFADFELILIDDCSTDETGSLCDALRKRTNGFVFSILRKMED